MTILIGCIYCWNIGGNRGALTVNLLEAAGYRLSSLPIICSSWISIGCRLTNAMIALRLDSNVRLSLKAHQKTDVIFIGLFKLYLYSRAYTPLWISISFTLTNPMIALRLDCNVRLSLKAHQKTNVIFIGLFKFYLYSHEYTPLWIFISFTLTNPMIALRLDHKVRLSLKTHWKTDVIFIFAF